MGGNLGVQFVAVLFQGGLGHAGAAVEVDDPLEGGVGLEPYNDLIFLVNIAGGKIVDAADDMGLHIQDSLMKFLEQQFLAPLPDLFRPVGGTSQKALVSGVWREVLLDEGAYVHRPLPLSAAKTFPLGYLLAIHSQFLLIDFSCCRFVHADLRVPEYTFKDGGSTKKTTAVPARRSGPCPSPGLRRGNRDGPVRHICPCPGCDRGAARPAPPGEAF